MPSCVVPSCTSGYGSNPEKIHFFTIPKDAESEKLWKAAIRRDDKFVKAGRSVCEKHFVKNQILWYRELLDANGRVLGITHYKIPRLKKGSVPSVFPWTELIPEVETTSQTQPCNTKTITVSNKWEFDSSDPEPPAKLLKLNTDILDPLQTVQSTGVQEETPLVDNEASICSPATSLSLGFLEMSAGELILPKKWVTQSSEVKGCKLFTILSHECMKIAGHFQTFVSKTVTIKEDLSVEISVYGRSLNPKNFDVPHRITSMKDLQEIISSINRLHICSGCKEPPGECDTLQAHCRTAKKDFAGIWRHVNCLGLLPNTTICQFCRTAKKSIMTKLRRWKLNKASDKRIQAKNQEEKAKWVKLQSKYRKALRARRQAREKIKTLRSELQKIRSQAARLTTSDLDKLVQAGTIAENQQHVLKEIIAAAKRRNLKGRKYSEEWILLCMLMHMRSSSNYEFLRSNDILPLPCVRTIRRYLSKIETNCGFDPQFFEVLKVALKKKEETFRHGILLLDEMATRESISVDTKNLTYKGLIDFGGEQEQFADYTQKANHGLVIMYQAVNEPFTQPVAVFASKGPVKGEVLAKLIVKCIALMEKIGVKIHGIVSDGAAPNRKFWSVLGVNSSRKNLRSYFEHPTIEGRKVYVFSDPPHLLKTIRNRLHNNGVLQVDPTEPAVKWEHIVKLYEADLKRAGPGQALMCPKLSKNHVYLNNSLKMRVRLAVQVFSNSVAGGLRFFRRYEPELRDCEPTAKFCKWMNDMFDAVNRKLPIDGVQPGNLDYKKIEESLQKLDTWEEHVEAKKLSEACFLTKQTADGLRVTLRSMLDLITYLTKDCGFSSVLTGRINQDPLERFFGTVRQAGGCNDHPSTPTFLNIYKILSIYSVLKPPKTGNCSCFTTDKPVAPLVTLSDLKKIYNDPRNSSELLQTVKETLDRHIENADWAIENIMEHDYSLPEVSDCVMYCLTADLTKRICNTVKCLTCKDALIKSDISGVVLPESVLTQWQQRDGIVHPNSHLYRFVLYLEKQFNEFCNSANVLEEILQRVQNYKDLSFPCREHAHDIILQLIQRFVRMRMQQYCTRMNANNTKNNLQKKKNSKFCIT